MPELGFLSFFLSALTLFSLQRIITAKEEESKASKWIFATTIFISLQSNTPSDHHHHSLYLHDCIHIYTLTASTETQGSKLKELPSDGVHEFKPTQDLNVAAIINSDDSNNLSSTAPITNDSTNTTIDPPNTSVSSEISVLQVNPTMESDSHHSMDIPPMIPSASPSQNEDNKLGFTVFAVELVGSLTNLAVSSKTNHNQVLFYLVVACSTLAFSISSTSLVLHKKRPTIAKKMQKAAFLIGMFGFLGIMGMLLPSNITWCFTISAFLVCTLMFAVANLIQ